MAVIGQEGTFIIVKKYIIMAYCCHRPSWTSALHAHMMMYTNDVWLIISLRKEVAVIAIMKVGADGSCVCGYIKKYYVTCIL